MSKFIYQKWTASPEPGQTVSIVPDGCRDLINRHLPGGRSLWHVSPLFDHCIGLQITARVDYTGYRLKPGTQIAVDKLLGLIERPGISSIDIPELINDCTSTDSAVDEALRCLQDEDLVSIQQAASRLGVSARTLQRKVHKVTQRTPGYWLQLARIRRAARALRQGIPLVEIACSCGFSDQAHMSREFQRWFRLGPSAMRARSDLLQQLDGPGYG